MAACSGVTDLGGNIYFLAKIGATDGKSFQQMAGSMTGMSEEEYRQAIELAQTVVGWAEEMIERGQA